MAGGYWVDCEKDGSNPFQERDCKMKAFIFLRLTLVVFLLALCGCRTKDQGTQQNGTVVVGIPADISTLNPIFVQEVTEGEITELIYPRLIDASFDTTIGLLRFEPSLAHSWDLRNENRDVIFHLRHGIQWSDSLPVTALDVQYSYELYGDSSLGSIRQSALDGLQKAPDGSIDIRKSIEVLNDSTVIFHFRRAYAGQLFDAGLPIVPFHVFNTVPRSELRTHLLNRKPIGAGPFALESWKPMQELVLIPNPLSRIPRPAALKRLVFRILPDKTARLQELKQQRIDLMGGLEALDVADLASSAPFVQIVSIPARQYFFFGWNNIDGNVYASSKAASVHAHPLFGSAAIRRALTYAINRNEMIATLLGRWGSEAAGPISPLFRWATNDTLTALPYDPGMASKMLSAEGWIDQHGGGIREKGGRRFSFSLILPAGNQFYLDIANIVQRQLREVGVEMRIQPVDGSTFFPTLIEKKYDACVAGFEIPLQIQMDDFWNSDLRRYPFNVVSFRNRRVDEILALAKRNVNEIETAPLWKEFQGIMYQEQPCTFLFWSSKLVGVNKRVQGTRIGVLGTLYHTWEWHTGDGNDR